MGTLPGRLAAALVLGMALAAYGAPGSAQDDLTIYRCTDAQGRLALQDFPCAEGQQQEVRTVTPPAPPAASAPVAPEPAPPPAPEPAEATVEVVIRPPPRPMYECITPDGERYTSDNGDGNPRPAPAWGWAGPWGAAPPPGIPPGPRSSSGRRAAGIASPGMSTSPGASLTTPDRPGANRPPPPRPPGHRYPPSWGYGSGWIRDECHPLPPSRVCELLVDRRTTIRRRIFNAQPSERAVLREEERDISARLRDDCRIH